MFIISSSTAHADDLGWASGRHLATEAKNYAM